MNLNPVRMLHFLICGCCCGLTFEVKAPDPSLSASALCSFTVASPMDSFDKETTPPYLSLINSAPVYIVMTVTQITAFRDFIISKQELIILHVIQRKQKQKKER